MSSRALRLCRVLFGMALALPLSANGDESPISLVRSGLPHDALYDIVFTEQAGFAVGANGALLVSEDGGQVWAATRTLSDVALLAVAASADRLVVAGQQGRILSGAGVASLAAVDSPTEERLLSVALDDSGLAVAVGGFGTVLISEDFGASWEQHFLDWGELHPEGLEAHLYDIAINADGEILICGEFAMILASNDRGATWQVRHRGDASLFAMHLDNKGAGLAVGQEGTILRTTDGGVNWQQVTTDSTANLLDVWQSPEGEAVAIGIRALLRSSDMGQSWNPIENRAIDRAWYAALASDVVTETTGNGSLSRQTVYAVGQRGNIVTINN